MFYSLHEVTNSVWGCTDFFIKSHNIFLNKNMSKDWELTLFKLKEKFICSRNDKLTFSHIKTYSRLKQSTNLQLILLVGTMSFKSKFSQRLFEFVMYFIL